MSARVTIMLLCAGFAALLVAGCGDDNGESEASGGSVETSVTTSSLSKAEFIKQAEAICARARETESGKLGEYIQNNRSPGQSNLDLATEGVKAVMLPRIEKEIEDVRKLGAPAGDEEQIEEFLRSEQEALEQAHDLERINSIYDVNTLFIESAKMAYAYGMPDCSNGRDLSFGRG